MNNIIRQPIENIGYGFIAEEFIPTGKDEYHLRNIQNRSGIEYRKLKALEIETLVRNNNTSDNWNQVLVSDAFNPGLVKNCNFFGLVRIGKLEPFYLEYHNLRLPVGLYNSTIISCDLGDNVVINNVNYMSHYIIGNQVLIVNVNELATTSTAKFGNGIIKDGESESLRIWMEICNENGGRSILPFNGMLPGDAYLWSKFRDNELLMQRFLEFTEKKFDAQRGYYGFIGDNTVIKNCNIIKDVWIGSHAYVKGANKIKNLTLNSTERAPSQVGEGCELVNGIIDEGCKIFYGVKAVRFIMASHSQLKYGARLINSYLGNNSTISCCEVLNALIFPFHEQHHNNSFLCAAFLGGQTNMAAGATIGSNHNSRSADGELVAGRGFWPGLCVSIKHNSRFASFVILAKGDFPFELNIPLPFSLVGNDVHNDRLVVMPAYWFLHNLYAITRNEWKYEKRDARLIKQQLIELSFLAPDSINETFTAIQLLEKLAGQAFYRNTKQPIPDIELCMKKGKEILADESYPIHELELIADDFENSKRKQVILKPAQAYKIYKKIIRLYAAQNILNNNSAALKFKNIIRNQWTNLGGQLVPNESVETLIQDICKHKIKDWNSIHDFYLIAANSYPEEKLKHAVACLLELEHKTSFSKNDIATLLKESIETMEWLTEGIISSRQKDHLNKFRKMNYNNETEMNNVLGRLENNPFIIQKKADLEIYKNNVQQVLAQLN